MHLIGMQMLNLLYLAWKTKNKEDLRKTRCKILADLSIEQFSTRLKHCKAVNILFSAPNSAQFLHFRLDSTPTESLGSKLPFRPILRPAYVDTPNHNSL